MLKNARGVAFKILNSLNKNRITLDLALANGLNDNPALSVKDKKLVFSICYGVIRWRGRLDWIIKKFSNVPIKKIDPKVLNILRIGIYQIVFLDRIPGSAAVNTSVELTKSFAPVWVVGFVNGILRKVSESHDAVKFPDAVKTPVLHLAAKKSFPKWLIERWLKKFGFKELERLCDKLNLIPAITLRTNTLKTNQKKLIKSLDGWVENQVPTQLAPDGVKCYKLKAPIFELDSFKDGWFQVQDEAAQLVSLFLNPEPGDRVLDAGAGFGGKTGHIAQLMKNTGHILAIDHSSTKLSDLQKGIKRLGITNVKTLNHDLNHKIDKRKTGTFKKVILDAPCSGLGVIRRNPDIKWSPFKMNLNAYQKKQISYLSNLAHVVEPSGLMVYAVCSVESEENENVVKLFLKKHPEFTIDSPPVFFMDKKISPLIQKSAFYKTFPHQHDMDGFFAVRFKKS